LNRAIKDCFKSFNDHGVGKVISPSQTCEIVLKKLQTTSPGIYKHNIFIERPTNIPQYRIIGTDYYRRVAGSDGANGKGHTREQALASGLMELVERYSCFKHLQNKHRVSSWNEMRDNPFTMDDFYAQFIDGRIRIDRQKLRAAQIRWVEANTLQGEKVYLPMDLIQFVLQGTNGMAAGNTFEEALVHALCEVVERHCLTVIKHNKLETPHIKQNTIGSAPANELIKRFHSIGLSPLIKDFSLGLALPVVGVITRFGKDKCNVTAGVAAHREEALIRALTENSQALGVGKDVCRQTGLNYCFHNSQSISFEEIPCVNNNNIRLEIESIAGLLRKQDMEIFYVDTTDRVLNIPAVNVYISGAKYYERKMAYRNSLIALANESSGVGKFKKAQSYISKGIDLKDRNSGAYFYFKALLLMSKPLYKRSIAYFLMALDEPLLNEEIRDQALAYLGICYEAIGDIRSAIDVYTRLLDLSAGEGFEGIAKRSQTLSSFPSGGFFVTKSLYEEIKSARWRSNKMGQQLFIVAFRAYQKKRSILTRLLNKTLEYSGAGRYEDCIRTAKEMISMHGLVRKIYPLNLFLANCFFALRQYKKAVDELLKAEKTDPDNEKINFLLARHYKYLGENKKYQEELNKGFRKVSACFRMKINLFDKPQGRGGWTGKIL